MRAYAMSQLSKVTYSRNQWKHKAKQRGDRERYRRKQDARNTAERNRITQALQASQARQRQLEAQRGQLEAQLQEQITQPKVEVVLITLQRFVVARIGFRAVSRVLSLLAWALGIKKAPCPQTVINWVTRLAIVRTQSARLLKGLPLSQVPFSNGLIWLIDSSIGLGTGKIVAVLAVDAHHHQLVPSALALDRVHCIGVSVADSWTGNTIAALLDRLIAQMGRPAASLKDGGSDLHKAVAILGEQGLASPCIDDISHAVAGMLKRTYQEHPSFATFLSACGRVSGKLKHTILACLAPPKVRTKARLCMDTACSPGPIRCLSCRRPGVPSRAPPSPSCGLVWINCPPAKPSSSGFAPMPTACWSARRFSRRRGSRTTPGSSASR